MMISCKYDDDDDDDTRLYIYNVCSLETVFEE